MARTHAARRCDTPRQSESALGGIAHKVDSKQRGARARRVRAVRIDRLRVAIEVAYRMFERWCQEKFFRYLRHEYALDALVDYQLEPANLRSLASQTMVLPALLS